MFSIAARLENMFNQLKLDKPMTVAQNCKRELEAFRKKIPIIRALRTDGIQARHIEEIKKVFGIDYTGEKESLRKIEEDIDKDKFDALREPLENIADTASKEYSNLNTMKKMKDEWVPLEFAVKDWKGFSYNLDGEAVEILQQALDDHLIKTQTMKGSPFAKFQYDEICEWEDQLIATQDGLEVWLKVQTAWMALEPVFSSDDIMKQMPKEGAKFKEVDAVWQSQMKKIAENPAALVCVKHEGLWDRFKTSF